MGGNRGRQWLGRARTVEAIMLLTAGTAVQKWLPMRIWGAWLGESVAVPSEWRGKQVERHIRKPPTRLESEVSTALRGGLRRLPWQPSCLAQATAGQLMLRRRGTAGVVVVGLRHSGDSEPWEAHAWLVGESGVLTGAAASRGFTATGVFEVPGQVTAAALAGDGLVE